MTSPKENDDGLSFKDLLLKKGQVTSIKDLQEKKSNNFLVISTKKIFEMVTHIVDKKVNNLIREYTEKDKKEIENAVRLEVFNNLKNGDDKTYETVELLEQRIAKMNKTLEATQKALKDVKSGKISEAGIGSIYDCIQGLDEDDDQFEAKADLLKGIFEQNKIIQNKE